MSQLSTKRLTKELKDLKDKGCPAGITLLESDDLRKWTFELEAYDSIYQGEKFALMFRFSDQYPIDSPAVQFIVNNTKGYLSPVHPHIYSNGHVGVVLSMNSADTSKICASILSDGWSPVLNVAAVCLTIQSMLTSCKTKERPPDNDGYVARAPENPKKVGIYFTRNHNQHYYRRDGSSTTTAYKGPTVLLDNDKHECIIVVRY